MKKRGLIRNEDGYFKAVLSITIIVFLIYAGFEFGMPYYRYSTFKTEAKELARISMDAEKTKAQIFEIAKELKIPIEEKALEVVKTEKTLQIKVSWSETVDLIGIYQRTLNFNIDIKE